MKSLTTVAIEDQNALVALFRVVLAEAGTRCSTSTTQDFKTVLRRFEHEGMSFLTITLPQFCSDFERSLDQGRVTRNQFTGFSRTGELPKFLRGFLELVFDASSGRLVREPSIWAIQAVRQLTLLFSKVSIRCSPEREQRALAKYMDCEETVRRNDSICLAEPDRLQRFGRIGRMLWADVLSKIDSRVYQEGVIPRHGPGATADKLRSNAKYNQLLWTRRLEEIFPHWENLIPSESFLDRVDGVTILEPGDELPVRVILVPKTLKTPRIIAIEPTCMQYMQQGILGVIVDEFAKFDNTRDFVMFKSQEPNQRLARQGSLTGTLATLDLSEASDRVSNRHVSLLLANHRELRRAVDATRSLKADVPGFGLVDLAKFASMGSALCFPFEALVFATAVFVGIEQALKRPLNLWDINQLRGKVRVYGDDIIVPTEYVQPVIAALESYGFKVNAAKSFWTGLFRESCGKEFYAGHPVGVTRVRNLLPMNRQNSVRVVSAVALRNQFFHSGYYAVVEHLDELIGKIIPFPFVEWSSDTAGVVSQSSPLLGRHAHTLPSQEYRHDPHLQRPLVRGVTVRNTIPASVLDDYGALMKHFLKQGLTPFVDERHLQRSGRPVSACITTQWGPVR